MDNLLIANIPYSCDDAELRHWIEEHGFKVDKVRLIRDVVSGSSPSFARVKLDISTPTEGAVQVLHQKPLGDRRIYVRRGRSPLDD
jgi:hypothetical protein